VHPAKQVLRSRVPERHDASIQQIRWNSHNLGRAGLTLTLEVNHLDYETPKLARSGLSQSPCLVATRTMTAHVHAEIQQGGLGDLTILPSPGNQIGTTSISKNAYTARTSCSEQT